MKPSAYLMKGPPVRRGLVWSSPSAVALEEEKEREREEEDDWSSIPVLVLWMIKDKLDIFDNKRLSAVCRDWWSASNSYPKLLQRVGDGLPWISRIGSRRSDFWEFVSVAREGQRVIRIAMPPECAGHTILFSRKGWLLMRKQNGVRKLPDELCLVNPLSRSRIELPSGYRLALFPGCFTTDAEGNPQRVFIQLFKDGFSKAVIKTVCPGVDKEWTDHTIVGDPNHHHHHQVKEEEDAAEYWRTRFFVNIPYLIAIGDCVYWFDSRSRVMALNLADKSCKVLPSPPSGSDDDNTPTHGFIAELEGGLIYVQLVYDTEPSSHYSFRAVTLYKYNHVASCWTRTSDDELKDTSLFYDRYRASITATTNKGKGGGGGGPKLYFLAQKARKRFSNVNDGRDSTWVEEYHVSTGNREVLHLPSTVTENAIWADIG